MAVIPNSKDGALELTLTNGDRDKLDEVLKKWGFKDYQSLMRFISSVMILTEDGDVWIKNKDGTREKVVPSDHLLTDTRDEKVS